MRSSFPFAHFVGRLALFVVAPVLTWAVLRSVTPIGDLVSLEDGILFVLAGSSIVAVSRPTTRVFTVESPLTRGRLFGLGVTYLSVYALLAVVWSVRWRTTGHATVYGEEDLRSGFRFVAILGFACVLVTSGEGGLYRDRVPVWRWLVLGAAIGAVIMGVGLVLYADVIIPSLRALVWPHDLAPTREMSDG